MCRLPARHHRAAFNGEATWVALRRCRAQVPTVPCRHDTDQETAVTSFAPRHRLALAVVLCSAVIVSAACASTGRAIGGDPFQGGSSSPRRSNDSAGELRIQVRNSNFNEATIYAIRLGSRRRLGRVQGASDGEFRMRLVNSDQIQFEVDLLASQGCLTRRVVVEPGQTVRLVIDSSSRPRSNGLNSLCEVQRGR